MKPKKTLSERLANRYQLVVRNEENLAEEQTFVFTYAKVLIALVLIIVFFLVLGVGISKTILAKWFDPKYAQIQLDKKIYGMSMQLDSLYNESNRRENFIKNLQYVLGSDSIRDSMDSGDTLGVQAKPAVVVGNMNLTPLDSQFRSEFEQSEIVLPEFSNSEYNKLQDMFFFPPIKGFISGPYDLQKGNYGIDIVAETNEPVKAIADGTVVLATWTSDFEYVLVVQHTEHLVSIYKHNAEILKKSGSFVAAGNTIALISDKKEQTGVPHLYLELWYNGVPLNPEEFISFY